MAASHGSAAGAKRWYRRRGSWLLVLALLLGLVGTRIGSLNDRGQEATAPSFSAGSSTSRSGVPSLPAESTPSPPSEASSPATTPLPAPTASADLADAAATLATLPVKGRAPMSGYERELFGDAWSDDVGVAGGHNGCDTRNDILRRDLVDIVIKPGSNGCAVQSGTLHDPYTAMVVAFVRGNGTSSAVQIDHVVALADAWQKGAQQLSTNQRADFANDPLNLQATNGPTNQAKGAGDAATWLPPNKAYRCTYVSLQVAVKAKYGLWVTAAEHDAIAAVLGNCGAPTGTPTTT